MQQVERSPNEGGCWFCFDDAGEMYFSWEFDCWLHMSCLQKELDAPTYNPEAEIIAKELGVTFTSKEPEFEKGETK